MNLNHITDVNEANEAIKEYKGGNLCLNGLRSSEKDELKKQYPNLKII
jgi:hypothetical protein